MWPRCLSAARRSAISARASSSVFTFAVGRALELENQVAPRRPQHARDLAHIHRVDFLEDFGRQVGPGDRPDQPAVGLGPRVGQLRGELANGSPASRRLRSSSALAFAASSSATLTPLSQVGTVIENLAQGQLRLCGEGVGVLAVILLDLVFGDRDLAGDFHLLHAADRASAARSGAAGLQS